MNWEAIGTVAEIIGAFAVVVSLIYLATEIRNQNRESRIASIHEVIEAFRNSITSFQDPQRADVYTKALSGFDDLEDAQRLQFISMTQGLFRVWEEAYYQFTGGRLDQRMWDAMLAAYADLMSAHGFQRVWALRRHTYSEEFRRFVDRLEPGEYQLK